MEQYQIDMNDSKVYPMGLTQTDGGIHVSVVAAAKACSLLLLRNRKVKTEKKQDFGKSGVSHSRRKQRPDMSGL